MAFMVHTGQVVFFVARDELARDVWDSRLQ